MLLCYLLVILVLKFQYYLDLNGCKKQKMKHFFNYRLYIIIIKTNK